MLLFCLIVSVIGKELSLVITVFSWGIRLLYRRFLMVYYIDSMLKSDTLES